MKEERLVALAQQVVPDDTVLVAGMFNPASQRMQHSREVRKNRIDRLGSSGLPLWSLLAASETRLHLISVPEADSLEQDHPEYITSWDLDAILVSVTSRSGTFTSLLVEERATLEVCAFVAASGDKWHAEPLLDLVQRAAGVSFDGAPAGPLDRTASSRPPVVTSFKPIVTVQESSFSAPVGVGPWKLDVHLDHIVLERKEGFRKHVHVEVGYDQIVSFFPLSCVDAVTFTMDVAGYGAVTMNGVDTKKGEHAADEIRQRMLAARS